MSTSSTSRAVSPDSGELWTVGDAWEVDPGVHRIPLPLPMDGLRAVNVYAIETDAGLTLVDGGWAITEARDQLDKALHSIGFGFADITRFLVTHAHRDHYTLAAVLGHEYDAEVLLGADDEPSVVAAGDPQLWLQDPFAEHLTRCGAADLLARRGDVRHVPEPDMWRLPSRLLRGDQQLTVGTRSLAAVHTPGHTPGHFVFADTAAGMLFAGDHVLPTITPSVGFTLPVPTDPLRDFLGSLAKVRALPDLRVLPAHGPVAASTHAVVDDLVAHHEDRLAQIRAQLSASGLTAVEVAHEIPWTRRARQYADLGVFDQGLAAMETHAHLEFLAARGEVVRTTAAGVDRYTL